MPSPIRLLIAGLVVAAAAPLGVQRPDGAALAAALDKMAAYVSGYGEKASLLVAVEKYSQSVIVDGADLPKRPRELVAEFAIIKTSDGSGWVGFRDVVEVNGEPLRERRDRLTKLFMSADASVSEATRIANESSRFNVGPVSRNFNVPTAAMFFFVPANLPRFTFTHKGTKTIDGVKAWEVQFKETVTPTLVRKASGADVPLDGTVWFDPADGTVVRTRLHMSHFADEFTNPEQAAPRLVPAPDPSRPQGKLDRAQPTLVLDPINSSATIDVQYRRHAEIGLWLPSTMEEQYVGPITITARPTTGRATTRATYTDFKQFGASARIVPQ